MLFFLLYMLCVKSDKPQLVYKYFVSSRMENFGYNSYMRIIDKSDIEYLSVLRMVAVFWYQMIQIYSNSSVFKFSSQGRACFWLREYSKFQRENSFYCILSE